MITAGVGSLRRPSRAGAWASRVRSVLWRAVCWLLGGLTVIGELPRQRAYVVVANHGSHADTAALLAALPPASRPVFAAAADYWFDVPARRAVASGLAGILPVRRGEQGAYAALLAAARPALAAGRTVVVYPEGTRSTDGRVGAFHSGAVRLAADCGVALVPAAVLGTRDVLPKHGRVRSAPMEVRIGAPRASEATDAGQLRADVLDLLARGPARRRTSAVWAQVARLVSGPRGLLVAFVWGLAGAPRWPVMAEMTLVFLAAAVPSRVPALASSIVAGSLAGVLLNARLAAAGWWLPAPLTTERMQAAARADLADGAHGILHQALSGIPVKLYARAAGELGTDPWALAAWAGVERGLRMAAVGLLVWLVARGLHAWLRRCYGAYLVLTAAGFACALAMIVAAWS
ncbi:MAG TPA: lysophospholipid acyltransferase family protein [Pseudonocardia sp.]|nr:lysophospholipid acyltransferase family protein [Pseudonocardia sp.]